MAPRTAWSPVGSAPTRPTRAQLSSSRSPRRRRAGSASGSTSTSRSRRSRWSMWRRPTGALLSSTSPTLAVHCSNNSDGDLDLMAATDTAYACCPTMYPRRGRFPRLGAFLERGIRTGFGTDWIRMDPWEGMRNAMCAVRLLTQEPEALPSRELLDLQTMGSARALGMADEIGSLAVG